MTQKSGDNISLLHIKKLTKQYIYIFASPQDFRKKICSVCEVNLWHCGSRFVYSSTKKKNVCRVIMLGYRS